MALKRTFFRMPAATISALITSYEACLTAIATAGQSYSIAGRTFTRAHISEVTNILTELYEAQSYQAGTRVSSTLADFRNPR